MTDKAQTLTIAKPVTKPMPVDFREAEQAIGIRIGVAIGTGVPAVVLGAMAISPPLAVNLLGAPVSQSFCVGAAIVLGATSAYSAYKARKIASSYPYEPKKKNVTKNQKPSSPSPW